MDVLYEKCMAVEKGAMDAQDAHELCQAVVYGSRGRTQTRKSKSRSKSRTRSRHNRGRALRVR